MSSENIEERLSRLEDELGLGDSHDESTDSVDEDSDDGLTNFSGTGMVEHIGIEHTCDFYVDEDGDCWVVHPETEPDHHGIDYLTPTDVEWILEAMNNV